MDVCWKKQSASTSGPETGMKSCPTNIPSSYTNLSNSRDKNEDVRGSFSLSSFFLPHFPPIVSLTYVKLIIFSKVILMSS